MRPDLDKVTTEHERGGSKQRSKKWGGKVKKSGDPEHLYEEVTIGKAPISRNRQYGYGSKHFSDVLNPLIGNLRKNVGRPWDKVYSEFCKTLDRRSLQGKHIFDHLKWEVEQNTFMNGKKVMCHPRHSGGQKPEEVEGFYVHPKTGLLCEAPRKRRQPKPATFTGKICMDQEGNLYLAGHQKNGVRYPESGDYFIVEEVGRSPKNRVFVWFRSWAEAKDVSFWKPMNPGEIRYAHKKHKLIGDVWHVWTEKTEYIYQRRSATSKEVAVLREFLKARNIDENDFSSLVQKKETLW